MCRGSVRRWCNLSTLLNNALRGLAARPAPGALGVVLLVLATLASRLANDFVNSFPASTETLPDLVHQLIPPVNLNLLVSAGDQLALVLIIAYLLFWDTENFPLALILLGVFFLIRAGFLFCTVLPTPFPRIDDSATLNVSLVFYGTRDLFPSGHTGSLFILAFLLKKNLWVRGLVFVLATVMGLAVVLMHVHYTIDVLGAVFIAYAVYAFFEKHVAPWAREPRGG